MKLPSFGAVGLPVALLLAGCASVPAVDVVALPAGVRAFKSPHAPSPIAAPQAGDRWWQAFGDRVLDNLEERAMRTNTTVQGADARLRQARAMVRATDSRRALQLDAASGASRGVDATTRVSPVTLGVAGASLGYEIDLFGRLAEATRAAALDAGAAEALLAGARLLVQGEVAQVYFTIRAVDVERQLVRDTTEAYRDSLGLTQRRYAAGDIAELDVVRVQNEVATNEAEGFALDRRRSELENALASLLGEPAPVFALGERDWDALLPRIPAGIPAQALARRPDVAAAQKALLASQARVGVARMAWLPGTTLTASGGYAATDLGDLLKWASRNWGVGALLSLPILDGGRRDAEVERSRGELEGALAAYRAQVLTALREVEDQLAGLRHLASQAAAQQRAVEASGRATALSNVRYRNGYVSQLELLDAQRAELRNRRQAVQVRASQYRATVGLVRALGGGWEAP